MESQTAGAHDETRVSYDFAEASDHRWLRALAAAGVARWAYAVAQGDLHFDSPLQQLFNLPDEEPYGDFLERLPCEDRAAFERAAAAALDPDGDGSFDLTLRLPEPGGGFRR